MRILGIDPGSRKAGFGVVETGLNQKIICLDYGVLRFNLNDSLPLRLGELARRLIHLIELHKPDHAVLEDVFVGKSVRSALVLGQSQGAVLSLLAMKGVPIETIPTRTVKQRITGSGSAEKYQVGEMVRLILGLPKKPVEDAADALALALCRAWSK